MNSILVEYVGLGGKLYGVIIKIIGIYLGPHLSASKYNRAIVLIYRYQWRIM